MKKINFSHKYKKLKGIGDEALLLQTFKVNLKDLDERFIIYDTAYYDEDLKTKFYPLPKTELILLFFCHEYKLFTTIRRYTWAKYEYYYKSIGELFKIVIEV